MKFLEGLADDIKKDLLEQLRVLWTHTSTAIEGNTLTLGETAFVLREGLAIGGKPLKDHRDIEGHGRAVDLVFDLVRKNEITEADLFDLHKLVIAEPVFDFYKPIGGWKRENNSTSVPVEDKFKIVEFSDFWEVPGLMERWLKLLNDDIQGAKERKEVLEAYAELHLSFAAIHPFWDGNGRIARLIANLPCLKAGHPPIIIAKEKRYDYIMTLADYTMTHGAPSEKTALFHTGPEFEKFASFCEQNWQDSLALVEEARGVQRERVKRMSEAGDYTP